MRRPYYTLDLPQSWIDDLASQENSELASVIINEPRVRVELSYFPALLQKCPINLAEVSGDLSAGFHIDMQVDAVKNEKFYRLTGSQFRVWAGTKLGKNTGQRLGVVSSVKYNDHPVLY